MEKVFVRQLHSLIAAVLLALTGCGGAPEPPPAPPEIVHAIEARKASYKEIGGAFKTISDEIKSGAPDINSLAPAAREVLSRARGQLPWFPPGSGPDSGVKTRAKPEVWKDFAAFTEAHEHFVAAAESMVSAVDSNDTAALAERHQTLGKTCKGCHDSFREPDE
jgi:cytochrome c556